MEDMASRLMQAREEAGFASAADAARALGVPYPTYAGHENGSSGFRAKTAEIYARKYRVSLNWLLTGKGGKRAEEVVPLDRDITGLPIISSIQAGHWLETTFIDAEGEPDMLPVANDPRFPRARQYALRVIGDSMDLDYPSGSYVTCVDFAESGLTITEGMTVHVERHRGNGQLVEITLKMVAKRNGGFILVPRSSNPIHQPIVLAGNETDVIVRGVVTGGWRQAAIPT